MTIDTEIFKFVERLKATTLSQRNPVRTKEPLKGHEPIIDLGEITDLKITQFHEVDGSTTSKLISVEEKMVGLNDSDFAEFKSYVLKLLDVPPFSDSCTVDFIIDRSFDWLISVYKNKKAEASLTTHLLDCIEKETTIHHFYFKIESLAIARQIQIGEVSIMFFTEQEIQEMYAVFIQEKPNTTFEEFKKTYKGLSKINAHIKIKGVPDRAEEIAKRHIELAVDTLKCYCIQHAIESKVLMFDLDYRIKKEGSASFINIPQGEFKNSTIQFRNLAGVIPVELDTETIDRFIKKGLLVIADFLIARKENELYYATIALISQLSEINSTSNNHEKIVKAISLCESILLPRSSSGKAKGITRIKKALPKIIPGLEDRAIIDEFLVDFYKIRDQYLHNGTRRPIQKDLLFFFLDFQRVLILKLIDLNKTMTALDEVLEYFEIT